MDALSAGLTASEIGELVDVSATTIQSWRKLYEKEGAEAFRKSPSSPRVANILQPAKPVQCQ
jgi:transposase